MHSRLVRWAAGVTVAVSVFGSAGLAHASSLTQPQVSAIIGLLQSFTTDQTVISSVSTALNGSTAPTATTVTSPSCVDLTTTLAFGNTDASTNGEVSKLQQFLGITPTTGYFGTQTQQALQAWQTSHNIISSGSPSTTGYGSAGPQTRAAMSCTAPTPSLTTSATTPAIPAVTQQTTTNTQTQQTATTATTPVSTLTTAAVTPATTAVTTPAPAVATAPIASTATTVTPKPAVGFNTFNYLFGYAQYQGYPTTSSYADNSAPYSLSLITNNLDFLSQHGITNMREIVPELAMEDTSIFYPAAASVMSAYQKDNFTLLLALGRPTVGQDLSNNRINCMTAVTDADWQTESNRLATTLVNFMKYLKTQPNINQTWLQSHVIIEPYNEFDSLLQTVNGQCANSFGFGTPQRAAVLQKAIASAFAQNGITNSVTMPSLATGNFGPFISAYYQAGGGGQPNIHTYYSVTDPATIESLTQGYIDEAAANAPSQYAGKLLLGEFGEPTQDATAALAVQRIFANTDIIAKTSMRLWWDYMSPDSWAVSPANVTPSVSSLNPVGQMIVNPPPSTTSTQVCPTGTTGTYPNCVTPTNTVPAAPASISATCATNGTSVTLSWSSSAGATSYDPRIAGAGLTSCATGWTYSSSPTPNTCYINSYANNSITYSGLTPGVSYSAWVHATNAAGTNWNALTSTTFSCPAPATQSCTTPWGTTVASGGSVTAYQTASVAAGQTCASQTRTCTNGVLSGTYAYGSCSTAAATTATYVQPTMNAITCNSNGSATLSWTLAPNSTALSGDQYGLRVDNTSVACNGVTGPNNNVGCTQDTSTTNGWTDYVENSIPLTTTSRVVTVSPIGSPVSWWVHIYNPTTNAWSPYTKQTFSCP